MDYLMFVSPNLDDMLKGRVMSKQNLGQERDLMVYDVRRVPELLWKSNPTFIDILYSKEIQRAEGICRNQEYSETVGECLDGLFSMRTELARMNLPYFWSAVMGIFQDRNKHYRKGTVNTAGLVERFGYDTKMVMHAMRVLMIAERFAESGFQDYGGAIWFDGDDREYLLGIRDGRYSLEEAKACMAEKLEYVQRYKESYTGVKPDEETWRRSEALVQKLVSAMVLDEYERIKGYDRPDRGMPDVPS